MLESIIEADQSETQVRKVTAWTNFLGTNLYKMCRYVEHLRYDILLWYTCLICRNISKYQRGYWIKKEPKCISKQFKFLSFQCSVRFEIQSAGKLFSTMHMLQAVSHNHLLSWRWMSREWNLTTFRAVQSQTTALRQRLMVQTHYKEAREVSRCGIRGTECDNERQTYPCA